MSEETNESPFTFPLSFQKKIIKCIMLGNFDAKKVLHYLKPGYFETPELQWMMGIITSYHEAYTAIPSWDVMEYSLSTVSEQQRGTYGHMVNHVKHMEITEGEYVRDEVLAWVRAKIFHKAFKESVHKYTQGKHLEAMALMEKTTEEQKGVKWEEDAESFFFKGLQDREGQRRARKDDKKHTIGTGIPALDAEVLNGGLSKEELGVWIGSTGAGKSLLLINHGAVACSIYDAFVYHVSYELTRNMIENRYDTWFSNMTYQDLLVKGLSESNFKELHDKYKHYSNNLIIADRHRFTKFGSNYKSVEGLISDLDQLKQRYAWKPDMIILDYADLMIPTSKHDKGYEKMDAVYQGLSDLAKDGYAIWTASQVNERDIDKEDPDFLLTMNKVSGSLGKLRAADFVGTINASRIEKEQGKARLFVEKYRSGENSLVIPVDTDFSRMKFGFGVTEKKVTPINSMEETLGYR